MACWHLPPLGARRRRLLLCWGKGAGAAGLLGEVGLDLSLACVQVTRCAARVCAGAGAGVWLAALHARLHVNKCCHVLQRCTSTSHTLRAPSHVALPRCPPVPCPHATRRAGPPSAVLPSSAGVPKVCARHQVSGGGLPSRLPSICIFARRARHRVEGAAHCTVCRERRCNARRGQAAPWVWALGSAVGASEAPCHRMDCLVIGFLVPVQICRGVAGCFMELMEPCLAAPREPSRCLAMIRC